MLGDDGKQVVSVPVRNQVGEEEPHLPLSKCTTHPGWSGLICFFFKREATIFFFLTCFLENEAGRLHLRKLSLMHSRIKD